MTQTSNALVSEHQIILDGYSQTSDIRDEHQKLVVEAIRDPSINFILLLGSPGIGKTTALKKGVEDWDNYLILYDSPRSQVNLDIRDKFKESDRFYKDDFAFLYADSLTIKANKGKPTVRYACNNISSFPQGKTVDFQPIDASLISKGTNPTYQQTDSIIAERDRIQAGVLKSLFSGTAEIAWNSTHYRKILATFATQSVKQTGSGKTSIRHFKETLFYPAFDRRLNQVNPRKLKQLAQQVNNIIFFVDEVTGDAAGAAMVKRVWGIAQNMNLCKHFNFKLIVADASLNNLEVARYYLGCDLENDRGRVYLTAGRKITTGLEHQFFDYNKKPAVMINGNCFPAPRLHLSFKACVSRLQSENAKKIIQGEYSVKDISFEEIAKDAMDLRASLPEDRQILVFIQDKRQIEELIEKFKDLYPNFEEGKDYLKIYSGLSETKRELILTKKDEVSFVFMTSSAARGISFPKCRHILVEMPRFGLESSLMEICQVIYRGRGDVQIEQEDEFLYFYVPEQVAIDTNQTQEVVRQRALEGTNAILQTILLISSAIETRIYGQSHGLKVGIVPVGEKAIAVAGQSLTSRIRSFIKLCEKEFHQHRDRPIFKKTAEDLRELCHRNTTIVHSEGEPTLLAYRDSFSPTRKTLLDLKQRRNFGQYYIDGPLVIVPLSQRSVEEKIELASLSDLLSNSEKLDVCQRRLEAVKQDSLCPPQLAQDAGDLVIVLQEILSSLKGQSYEATRRYADEYLAFPVVSLLAESLPGLELNEELRTWLERYLKKRYASDGYLPIGEIYDTVPFVTFRCTTFKETRTRTYSTRHLALSYSLNVFNLLLGKERT